jgi:hypothetical protein
MTHKYEVTVKWYETKENPENKANNGYDFITVYKTYKININDKYDELMGHHARAMAIDKALLKAQKDSGYNRLTYHNNIDKVTKIDR